MKQLKLDDWKMGLDQNMAIVPLSPDEIESRLGVKFELDYDDLDHYKACVLDVDGAQLVLKRYLRYPDPGTDVMGSFDTSKETCRALLQSLDVSSSELTWIRLDFWDRFGGV